MTVVTLLKLNPELGIGCSDERATYGGLRTYDTIKKLRRLAGASIGGGSGYSVILNPAFSEVNACASEDKLPYGRGLAEELQKRLVNIVRGLIYSDRFIQRGATLDDIEKSGRGMDEGLKMDLKKVFEEGMKHYNSDFVIGGFEQKRGEFVIYSGGTDEAVVEVPTVRSIGSGSDQTHARVQDYLHRKHPPERENITLSEGALILMEATRASWHNVGVGGRTQVMWTGKGYENPEELGFDQSNILMNTIFLRDRGTLDTNFVREQFEGAVGGATAKDIISAVGKKVNKADLMRVLVEGLVS